MRKFILFGDWQHSCKFEWSEQCATKIYENTNETIKLENGAGKRKMYSWHSCLCMKPEPEGD